MTAQKCLWIICKKFKFIPILFFFKKEIHIVTTFLRARDEKKIQLYKFYFILIFFTLKINLKLFNSEFKKITLFWSLSRFKKKILLSVINTITDWEKRLIKEGICIQFANEYIKPLVDLLHSLKMQYSRKLESWHWNDEKKSEEEKIIINTKINSFHPYTTSSRHLSRSFIFQFVNWMNFFVASHHVQIRMEIIVKCLLHFHIFNC